MTDPRFKEGLPVDPTLRALHTVRRALMLGLCMAAALFCALAATGHGADLRANLAAAKSHLFGANAAGVRVPRLSSPADDAVVEAVPAFSWSSVKGGAKYEFQLSADPDFTSLVLTKGNHGQASVQTLNTYATIDTTLSNGTYYWRARAIDKHDDAGRWSPARSFRKSWTTRPQLLGPESGLKISYPRLPLVLRWSKVPHAFKYMVEIGTDPSLGSLVGGAAIETSGNVLAPRTTLSPGTYYWAVTPLDSDLHKGARSAVNTFDWEWPTATGTNVSDLNADPRVFDPQFSWDPVPGAARYEVEINSSEDFAIGSKVCCNDPTIGTSLSPLKVLPNNNHYYWRMRAVDLGGNAGVWNVGTSFDKNFDNVTPTVPGLQLRDIDGSPLPAGSVTSDPLITWDPVPGASSYEVKVVPYDSVNGACDWTNGSPYEAWHEIKTATTAWTPLGHDWNLVVPGGVSYPNAANDGNHELFDGHQYCMKVLARSDRDSKNQEVVSDWTQLGALDQPAFEYAAPTITPGPPGVLTTPAANYMLPQMGTVTPRMPYFTWDPVDGAQSYFVVVAKDSLFTDVVDVGFTQYTVYAPRATFGPKTYPDETSSYYWAVMPARNIDGSNVNTTYPWQNNPRNFQKRSTPPGLLAPASGADVTTQPMFRWTPAEAAREYRLQVAQDPTFHNLLDDVTTTSTAYTSSTTYPADTSLYWRVRANDESKVGLTWSAIGSFRRRLPAPVPSPDNPTSGTTVPVLTWSPVQGATSYDFRVEQPDGVVKVIKFGSNAATFVVFAGTGVWRWQVRANFPKNPIGETPGPYSPIQTFIRRIDAPPGARYVNARRQMLLSWDPVPMVKEYKVQVSPTDSFSRIIETHETENTDYAPLLALKGYTDGGTLYWRVAGLDEGKNLGGWTTRQLSLLKLMNVRASGSVRKGKRGVITVTVTDAKRRPVRKAKVRISGVARARAKRTGRKGTVKFKIRPRRKGNLVVGARKGGYQPGRAAVQVR